MGGDDFFYHQLALLRGERIFSSSAGLGGADDYDDFFVFFGEVGEEFLVPLVERLETTDEEDGWMFLHVSVRAIKVINTSATEKNRFSV